MPEGTRQSCASHEEKTLKEQRKEKAKKTKQGEGWEIQGKRLSYRFVVSSYAFLPCAPIFPIQ